MIVVLLTIRRFIIDEEHIFFKAVDLCFHNCLDILLSYMPDNLFIFLFEAEFGLHMKVKLGKIEVIFFPFIIEYAQKPSVQRHKVDLRPTATNIKNAVL